MLSLINSRIAETNSNQKSETKHQLPVVLNNLGHNTIKTSEVFITTEYAFSEQIDSFYSSGVVIVILNIS